MTSIKQTRNKDIFKVNEKTVVISKYKNKTIYIADDSLTFEEQKTFNNHLKILNNGER